MEIFNDGEQKILCPYNQAHHIRKCRMECHLTKCRKSYVGEMATCDFNTTHRIPVPELSYHYETCSDRKKIEVAVYKEKGHEEYERKYAIQNIPVPVDDSWDTNVTLGSYDPQKYCEQNNIIRRLDTESAAVRRNFRLAERSRLSKIAAIPPQSGEQPKQTMKLVLPPLPRTGVEPVVHPPQSVIDMMEKLSVKTKKTFFSVCHN